MDTLRLLSRGTKGKSARSNGSSRIVPSAEAAQPQLFGGEPPTKKRRVSGADGEEQHATSHSLTVSAPDVGSIKSTLKQHKIKVAWLRPPPPPKKSKRSQIAQPAKLERPHVFPMPVQDLSEASLIRLGIPQQLAANIRTQGYSAATEAQMAALPLILDLANASTPQGIPDLPLGCPNLLTVAPTGSGKTLAFLIPTISRIMAARAGTDIVEGGTAALILAPTKELVGQIVNEGKILLQGVDLKISAYRKDMVLDAETTRTPDILVSTPGSLATTLQLSSPLLTVQYLVLDEADVLLDPLFREQTISIWNNLHNPQLRTSLWSATMGSNIEDLALELIRSQQQVSGATDEVPLIRLVVGLKDSAVPNIEHRLVYAANEQGKLMGLRSLLHPATAAEESLRPPFMVFTQTIERAIALHHEMLYDIPTEAGGVSRIAVLHANLSDNARSEVMARFRKGEIWILITTDLLSRGIDFRGVNGVVNYDIPTSSAAYVHRAGRTGRAGRQGGVAVTLYTKDDIPYLKQIANVIAAAQKQGKLEGNASVQQWLLDSLPTLSQTERKKFKKHGVESRTARGMENDPKAARRARISTQAGYIRKIENNRKASIAASRRRAAEAGVSDDSDGGFAGFS